MPAVFPRFPCELFLNLIIDASRASARRVAGGPRARVSPARSLPHASPGFHAHGFDAAAARGAARVARSHRLRGPRVAAHRARPRSAAASTTSTWSPTTPSIMFVATASGGIFKTVNAGVTWAPVFDADGGSLSIGDIAIAPSDRNIVWAGTGEPNNRQSSSWGDGVYKSVDGGDHVAPHGPEGQPPHRPHRRSIRPIPRSSTSPRWATCGDPNAERGLYKTVDGGKNWRNVLSINADTGVVDVALDADGRTLFAAAYQRRRRGWGFVGGGPNGGLFRSLDGGETWERLAAGLPGRHRRPHRRRDREERPEHRLRRVRAQERRRVPLARTAARPGCT